jgi:hypothetical protein
VYYFCLLTDQRKWPEEKLPVALEPINGFNLRAQVVGRGGDNVKFIQQETGCKVQIKGQGSGFMESSTGQEAEEPMYLHIAGPMPEGVAKAKGLCEELLERVRTDYQEFKENAPHHRFGGGGGGGDRYSNGRSGGYDGRSGGGYEGRSGGYDGRPGGYGDRERSQSYGQTGYGGQGGQSDYQQPAAAAAADPAAQGADYSQWQAYYAQTGQQPGADPYAQYGGYEGYVQWYNYYAQLQQQSPAPGTAAAPPPPPSDPGPPGGAPPPPPPSGSPPGTSYNAVSKPEF